MTCVSGFGSKLRSIFIAVVRFLADVSGLQSKAWVCSPSIAGIVVSIPAVGISSIMFVVCRIRDGICDEVFTRSEKSYRVYLHLIVCDLETSTVEESRPNLGSCATKEKQTEGDILGQTPISLSVKMNDFLDGLNVTLNIFSIKRVNCALFLLFRSDMFL